MSETTVHILGRPLRVALSPAAEAALAARGAPLCAEMELYFSCLIRKRVRFHEAGCAGAVAVGPSLEVRFRPVMTRACGKDYEGEAPPLTDFPVRRAAPYVPRWLRIHYARGRWEGEFGYR